MKLLTRYELEHRQIFPICENMVNMLETPEKVNNFNRTGTRGPTGIEWKANPMIVQIYEIQTPPEAEKIMDLGVTNMGSVILSKKDWRLPIIRETVRLVQSSGVQSSVIPLFPDKDTISNVLDYYTPDIVHFCDAVGYADIENHRLDRLIRIQEGIRARFPGIKIMRSIPIPRPGLANSEHIMAIVSRFEAISDIFLTDTVLGDGCDPSAVQEPVDGFVGITGKICDWEAAQQLVDNAHIPVILAGGISPENAYEAVLQVQPAGIDSCTGTNAVDVDGNPVRFQKDRDRVKKMVQEIQRAERVMDYRNCSQN
jgi:phosphoribosylanthranilate isomerase